MRTDFLPSTKKLIELVAWHEREMSFRDERDELYRIREMCVRIANRAYGKLGPARYKLEPWGPDEPLVDALRQALADHRSDYAGQDIAYTLLRYGDATSEVIAALHPWRRLMFRWRDARYTAQGISQLLSDTGVAEQLPHDSVEKITSWISNPLLVAGDDYNHYSIVSALFDTRMVVFSLRDVGFEPRHDQLLEQLAAAAVPPVEIGKVRQAAEVDRFKVSRVALKEAPQGVPIFSDEGSHWSIHYTYAGRTFGFFAESKSTWMDVGAVIRHFNHFMDTIGRRDHAFRLGVPADDSGEWGLFVVADRERFPTVADRLYIPLHG